MRHVAAALLLLVTVAAEGQFAGAVEHSYGSISATDYALAASRNGALLAWNAEGRIELPRIDYHGRLVE